MVGELLAVLFFDVRDEVSLEFQRKPMLETKRLFV